MISLSNLFERVNSASLAQINKKKSTIKILNKNQSQNRIKSAKMKSSLIPKVTKIKLGKSFKPNSYRTKLSSYPKTRF